LECKAPFAFLGHNSIDILKGNQLFFLRQPNKKKSMIKSANKHPYQRILLKLSGELLMQGQPFGIHTQACQNLATNIKNLHASGLEIGIVIGGGNIFRGTHLEAIGIPRAPADQMGMLATLINGIALQEALEAIGCKAKVFTALECPKIADTYTWRAAMEALQSKTVVIFVGGTGNPYFTTDSAAALRASEIQADALLKATKVDGIYSKDPLKYPDAVKYSSLSYSEMLNEKLEVMDATAVALCRSNRIPILVFDMQKLQSKNLAELLANANFGTVVSGE
jgi:uridylate kinase